VLSLYYRKPIPENIVNNIIYKLYKQNIYFLLSSSIGRSGMGAVSGFLGNIENTNGFAELVNAIFAAICRTRVSGEKVV
jgi:hypothetical protein